MFPTLLQAHQRFPRIQTIECAGAGEIGDCTQRCRHQYCADILWITPPSKAVITVAPLTDWAAILWSYEIPVIGVSTSLRKRFGHLQYFSACAARELAITFALICRNERCSNADRSVNVGNSSQGLISVL